jgi:hypothetical protein
MSDNYSQLASKNKAFLRFSSFNLRSFGLRASILKTAKTEIYLTLSQPFPHLSAQSFSRASTPGKCREGCRFYLTMGVDDDNGE